VAAVYILFRLFDTLKLPPCRQLEHLPAGWGIPLEDIAVGIQVNMILQVVLRLWRMCIWDLLCLQVHQRRG
jgi:phosphatidylglycerophosphatase A